MIEMMASAGGFTKFVHAAYGDGTLRKLYPDGSEAWVTSLGSTALALDVSVDNRGFSYAPDIQAKVSKISPDGTIIWSIPTDGKSAEGIAVDLDGFVYTCTPFDGKVRKIDPDGNLVWTYTGFSGNTTEVAVDEFGNVFAGNSTSLHKINSNGSAVWTRYFGSNNDVNKISLDRNGYSYVAVTAQDGTGKFKRIDPSGNIIWATSNDGLYVNTDSVIGKSIAFDPNGFVYGGTATGGLSKWDLNGNLVWAFQIYSTTSDINDISVNGKDGYLYVASEDNTVKKIDLDGNVIWTYSDPSETAWGVAAAPGEYGAGF